GNGRDEAHADAEHERHRERKLSEKHERIDDVEERQVYALDQLAVKSECGMLAHLPGPILETAGDGQRQLPEANLEPLRADQQAANPGDRITGTALLRIF